VEHGSALVFIELGAIIVGLAILARLSSRIGFSAIPLYLLAGLAFGNGGLLPLRFGDETVRIGADIGVILLLFMLGLEYTGTKLVASLEKGWPFGILDFILNFTPGAVAGVLLGYRPIAAVLLGGITYISSSGIVAKILADVKKKGGESQLAITVLVLEDLAMAVYLPVVSVLLTGAGLVLGLFSVGGALATVFAILLIAVRFGRRLSDFVSHQSDEVLLLSTLGLVLLVAGFAEQLQISAAIGAFIVGVAVSGPMLTRAHRLISPLRDLFAAAFFFFFGLQVDPSKLPPVLGVAILLGVVTAMTKVLTGVISAKKAGLTRAEGLRAGSLLVARGEFSVVIAGLGAGLQPQLESLAAAYVLFLAIVGPLLSRIRWEPKAELTGSA
jgi:CPA2 family monovalent cation:H+ antiporter-2